MASFLAKYKNMDLLEGSLWDKIVVFALPLALTSILQQLFNAADVAVLGRFVGSDAVAAVGNNIPIIGLVVNLFVGISLGANVVVARYIGMKDPDNANDAVHTAFSLALIIGVTIAIVGIPFADTFVSWLGVPDNVKESASTYLQVYFLGMPFIAMYNFEAALFRSKGDTNTPLIALAYASVFNIAGNLVVVLVLDMGIGGVALTTALSNLLCALYLFYKLRQESGFLHLCYHKIAKFKPRKARAIVSIGLPAGIQGMVFSLSNLLIQSAINSLGTDAMAASAAAFTIEINVYCLINAFGLAATTFISQNYGAGNLKRCRQVTHVCFYLDLLISGVFSIFILFFSYELVGFFSDSETVIALGVVRILYVVAPEMLSVAMEIMSGTMRGFGYSLPPALMTLCGICGVRIIWIFSVFNLYPSYATLMAVYGISWLVTTILLYIIYVCFIRKLQQNRHDSSLNTIN